MNFLNKSKPLLCILTVALLATACGKTGNKVNTYGSGQNAFSTSNPAFNSSVGSSSVNQYQSIKSQVPCTSGTRLMNDVNFYATSGSFTGSKLLVNGWTKGFFTGGTINKMWVGVSVFKDLMFVTQVVNQNNQVVGFNVTLSFCEVKNTYQGLPSVVSDARELTNFQTPNGIVLDSDTYCGYNMVDAAVNTYIVSLADQSNSYYTQNAPIVTTFTKMACNGRY